MVEVKYHRVKIKKTPRPKGARANEPVPKNMDLYYVLDKNVPLNGMFLTGTSVFSKNEIVEIQFYVAKYQTYLRMLAKIKRLETFVELNRPLFRGDLQFAAVSKEDYERLRVLDAQRQKAETQRAQNAAPAGQDTHAKNSMRLTFKRS